MIFFDLYYINQFLFNIRLKINWSKQDNLGLIKYLKTKIEIIINVFEFFIKNKNIHNFIKNIKKKNIYIAPPTLVNIEEIYIDKIQKFIIEIIDLYRYHY